MTIKHWTYGENTYIKINGENVNLNSEAGVRLVEKLHRDNQALTLRICELETKVSQVAGRLGQANRKLKALEAEGE